MTSKQFHKLPKKRKAVLVAQDILAQLEAKRIKSKKGYYISHLDLEGDIKENFDKIKHCEVCMMGGMVLSAAHLGNNLCFEDINGHRDLGNTQVLETFQSVFDTKQALLIELAFEGFSEFKCEYKEDWKYIYENVDGVDGATRLAQDQFNEIATFEEASQCTSSIANTNQTLIE